MQEIQGLLENLEQMEKVDIKEISISNLPNIKDIEIDKNKLIPDKFIDYLKQVKNPYVYRFGDYTVKFEFGGKGRFSDILINFFNNL